MAGTPTKRNRQRKSIRGRSEIDQVSGAGDYHVNMNALQGQQHKYVNRIAAVRERRKVVYARARRQAGSISTAGLTYIEDIWASLRQLQEQEKSFQSFAADYAALKRSREDALRVVPELCDGLVHDLGSRRSSCIDSACEMVSKASDSHQGALKLALKRARSELDRIREKEKLASDATEYINDFKRLLTGSSDG